MNRLPSTQTPFCSARENTMTGDYGSLDNAKGGQTLPGEKSTAVPFTLAIVVIAVIVALLAIQFGAAVISAIVTVLVVLFVVSYLAFCCAAVPYSSSAVKIPVVAIKLQFKVFSLFGAYAARGFKPEFPQWTFGYELTNKVLRYTFEQYGHLLADKNAHLLRPPFEMHGKLILKSNSRKHGTVPEKLVANGMDHMWLRDPVKKEHRVVVIHFHGGGYTVSDPLQDVELANLTHTKLQQALKSQYQLDVSVDVLLANYRMAPQFLYPTAVNDCFDMYKYVLEHENISPDHVVFSGDSAGGEMTITNCMRLRDSTPELKPAAALCYSPFVDLAEKGGDEVTPHCCLAANWLDNAGATYLRSVDDPDAAFKVSPINKDLKNLPPTFLQFGTLERFYKQGLRFKAKADAQGVTNMELDLLENMVHDPVMLPTMVSPAAEGAISTAFIVLLAVKLFMIVLSVVIILLVIAYVLLFAGFCYAAYPFATSFVLVPYIAIKMQVKLISLLAAYVARGFKPTFPEWTLVYEITIAMMRYTFLDYGHIVADVNAHRLRPPFEMHGKFILKSNSHKHGTVPEKLVANGMEHMWLRDPVKKQHRVVVIHYHGGGYCISDPLQDVELANQTHTKLQQILKKKYQLDASIDVLLANYRMAPQFLYPTALNDCFDIYQYVLKHENISPDHVVFSGDSAGAEMSMTNCMRLRKESPELQPVAALCYSPVVDFSETDNDEKTPYCILAANFADNCLVTYLRDVTDPEERRLVSPINHSLKDLPPIFLQWGTLERFYEQGLRFKAKADAEGVTNMELDILENIVHDPVMFPTAVSPAAEKGIHHGCEFTARYLARVLSAKAKALR
ncbi:hypothetical protein BBP00_00006323 [Phytophthora kernoviae]|uniref:Alpha/beta hydrolase fold-3 domain-containing protein n=1 Tax=Phytophthora kernoviae TaxID=325452 RepID=A0A3F2RLI0_9STRA|nr:hypothetical protein BBP00_00006323 [Phytophthora kernoviae]